MNFPSNGDIMDSKAQSSSSEILKNYGDSRRGSNQDSMRAIQRAILVLNTMIGHDEPVSVIGLSKATGLSRSVVYRITNSLREGDILNELSPGLFSLGPQVLLYANSYLQQLQLRRVSLPYATDLRASLTGGEKLIVSLNLRAGDEMTVIDALWGSQTALDTILLVGTHFDLLKSCTGRVVAAYMEEDLLCQLVGIANYREILPRLDEIRHVGGVDYTDEDFRSGVQGIGARVPGLHGVDAALSVYGSDLSDEFKSRSSGTAMKILRTAQAIGFAMTGRR